MLFAGVTITLERPLPLALALLTALLLAFAARLEPWPTLKRLAALDGFMVAMVALLPVTMSDLQVGMEQAARIVARANAVMLALLALLGAMGPVRLGHGLAGLGLPSGFVQLFLFTTRYIAVIEAELARLRLAMRARCFRLTASRHAWRSMGQMFGMLLVRSLERAERIHAAMRCRGFTGRFPNPVESRWDWADAALLLTGAALLTAGAAWAVGLLLLELPE